MKALITVLIIAAVLVLAGSVYLLATQTPEQTGRAIQQINPAVSSSSQGTTSEPGIEGDYEIEIRNYAFSPVELRIEKGDTVVWENYDSVQHTVTSDSGSELNSDYLPTGEKYSHTFNTEGTFEYHCIPHPNMKARIIVGSESESSSASSSSSSSSSSTGGY